MEHIPQERGSHRWLPVAAALVALVTALAFLPALSNGFVKWDDDKNFLENPDYRGLGPAQLRWMLTTFLLGHWVPLTWVTLGLDYMIWGLRPAGYHLTNVLLHAGTAAVAVLVFARILAAAGLADRRAVVIGAAVGALAFAIHPLRVESVAWVTERRDVLSGLFYLLAILAYLHAAGRARDVPAWRSRAYWLSVIAFTAALLSKAMVVTLPAVLVVLDVYPLRRRAWREKLPFFGLALAVAFVALLARASDTPARSLTEFGLIARAGIAFYSLAFYLWKTLLPFSLSPLYEFPVPLNLLAWRFLGSVVVIVALTVLAIAMRRRWPALAAAGSVYVVTLLPVSGILLNGPQLAADRYTYLPCLSWALLVGALVARSASHWHARPEARKRIVALGSALAGVLGGLGVLTWHQTHVWRDTDTLWSHAVAVTPSPQPLARLADHRFATGHTDDAMELARRVLDLQPDRVDARNTLGLVLAQRGDLDLAVRELRRAVQLKPENSVSHNNLGAILARQGQWESALEEFREAVRLRPDSAPPNHNLATALNHLGRHEEARPYLERVEQLRRRLSPK